MTVVRDQLIGHVLDDRYMVIEQVARGGMAMVYRGVDLRLDRSVAIKVMHPHLIEDEGFVSRFKMEALHAAKLSHPNLVAVHDQGREDDTVYLVMEYLPSETLRDRLRREGRLSPGAAMHILDAILAALEEVHRSGIIHRDLKPDNILLGENGQIKLADFGLARAVSTSTTTKTLIGTVGYVAPELVTRSETDDRTDLYTVGIVLYEMLTGHPPYTDDMPIQVAYRHVHDSVPAPSEEFPELPAGLDEIVTWSTQRKREDRPSGATEMRRRLAQVAASLTRAELDLGDLESDELRGLGPAHEAGELSVADAVPAATRKPKRRRLLRRSVQRIASTTRVIVGLGAEQRPAEPVDTGAALSSFDRIVRVPSEPVAEQEALEVAEARELEAGGSVGESPETVDAGSEAAESAVTESEASENDVELVDELIDDVASDTADGIVITDGGSEAATVEDEAPASESADALDTLDADDPAGADDPADVDDPAADDADADDGDLLGDVVLDDEPADDEGYARKLLAAEGDLQDDASDLAEAETADDDEVPPRGSRSRGEPSRARIAAASLGSRLTTGARSGGGALIGAARRPRGRITLAALAGILVLILVGVWAFTAGPLAPRTIPADLVGQDTSTAVASLEELGLEVVIAEAYDDGVPAGLVVSTDPAPGEQVRTGAEVTVTGSLGPELFTVPDLSGSTVEEATTLLEEAGLAVGEVTEEYDADVPEGQVIGQSEETGEELEGRSSVDLVISDGAPPLVVPNVRGLSYDAAAARLSRMGFLVARDDVFDSDVPAGQVISQTPGEGAERWPEDLIMLKVSKGPMAEPEPPADDAEGGDED